MELQGDYFTRDFQQMVEDMAIGNIQAVMDALDKVLRQDVPLGQTRLTAGEMGVFMEQLAATDPVRAAAILMTDESVRQKLG